MDAAGGPRAPDFWGDPGRARHRHGLVCHAAAPRMPTRAWKRAPDTAPSRNAANAPSPSLRRPDRRRQPSLGPALPCRRPPTPPAEAGRGPPASRRGRRSRQRLSVDLPDRMAGGRFGQRREQVPPGPRGGDRPGRVPDATRCWFYFLDGGAERPRCSTEPETPKYAVLRPDLHSTPGSRSRRRSALDWYPSPCCC